MTKTNIKVPQKGQKDAKVTKKREIGNLGESAACKYLEKQGLTILCRNYLRKCGEIDVVAEKEQKLFFIEVKASVIRETQSGSRGGIEIRPEENINYFKIKKLKKVIELFLAESKLPPETNWQCDGAIVLLNMETRLARVNIIPNINIA